MLLYGNKFIGYPGPNSGLLEKEISTSEMMNTGAMCLPVPDWHAQEQWIIDVESFIER
jgi:hypothetical protein